MAELYDHGRTVTESEVLLPRLAKPALRANEESIAKLGVEPGDEVELHLNGDVYVLPVGIDSSLSEGIVLVGQSQGVPVMAPVAVQIKAVS